MPGAQVHVAFLSLSGPVESPDQHRLAFRRPLMSHLESGSLQDVAAMRKRSSTDGGALFRCVADICKAMSTSILMEPCPSYARSTRTASYPKN